MMKNAFYFMLTALSFLRYFHFCPDFWLCGKMALFRNLNVTYWATNIVRYLKKLRQPDKKI